MAKLIYAFLFLTICQTLLADVMVPTTRKSVLDKKLEAFLIKLQGYMKTGNDTLFLPKLEPFDLKFYKFHFLDRKLDLKIQGNLKNVHIDKLSYYNVTHTKLTLQGPNATVGLAWEELSGSSDYKFVGKILDIPIYGNGQIKFVMGGLEVNAKIDTKARQDKKMSVIALNAMVALQSLNLKMTGILDNEEISEMYSHIISENAPALIENFQHVIMPRVKPMLIKLANNYVSHFTFTDIIKLVQS